MMIRSVLIRNIAYFNACIFFLAGVLLGLGQAQNALSISFVASVFWIVFRVERGMLTRHLFFLYVSLLPIINFAKGGFFFYNIITVLLLIFTMIFIFQNGVERFMGKNGSLTQVILFSSLVLYVLSVINMGRYDSNLKIFELVLTAILFVRLVSTKSQLLFLTKILSVSSVSLILFLLIKTSGNSNRLMVNTTEYLNQGIDIGGSNPINYGLPIVFCLLVYTVVSQVKFSKRPLFGFAAPLILIIALFLTTSRGSLLVLATSFLAYLVFSKRIKLVFYVGTSIIGGYVIFSALAGFNPEFRAAFDFLITRTQELDDINQISHGRLEQWQAMYEYISADFSKMIFGFGPGNQYYAHSIISSILNEANTSHHGKEFAYHALLLRILAEIGLIGMFIYLTILTRLVRLALGARKKLNIHSRIVFLIGWIAIGLSVSSFDSFSGLFLGMGITGINWYNKES